ncbi:MAG: hypothetical protein Q7T84_19225 [Phenylobacterium sp.]|uniref:hypothetical protein n=1 Tax=Phenylobacterium sp. TaxID=1871053 RepID=UPI002715F746|nr:hypothetical protein [Phenylobacterium sp.]MDO9433431.1 hypothetical protein [Phenylobacterium sp.]
MMIRTLLTATAALALLAGGAHAGDGKKQAKPAAAPAAASQMGTDSSSQSMSNPPVSADAMSAGVDTSATAIAANTRLITNGPVADTPENRAKFPPLSKTGRNTKPRGN